jgi:hypothetical protein
MKTNIYSIAAKASDSDKLIDRVRKICARLDAYGWGDLLKAHGLDIRATDLEAELLRPLKTINRDLPGFQDFAREGCRGIEPGKAAQSLLYHAFASPQVINGVNGKKLRAFPTPAEIATVENLCFGIRPPSIQELRLRVKHAPLAIAVFSSEYRPAISTIHQKHADLCFARVGVARIGTAPCEYLPEARGYLPMVSKNPHAIRVLPCRYVAYIAAQLPGQEQNFGPLRFQTGTPGDRDRKFWVPVHKLFSGSECIRGLSLDVKLKAQHLNEKLRRVHRVLGGEGIETECHEPKLGKPPFTIREGLAEFSKEIDDGEGLLVPLVYPRLIEPAQLGGKPLAYRAPANRKPFRSSLIINSRPSEARSAPEYVHIRHKLEEDGKITNLNDLPDMLKIIETGDYRALHYIDHTADGCIEAQCSELALELPRSLAAYSMVGAVDFFPLVKQQELMQWWEQSVPPELQENIWPTNPGPPLSLCDIRYPPNLSLTAEKLNIENEPRRVFDPKDDTMTAIVGLIDSASGAPTKIDDLVNERVSMLSDGAAGVFAPGWDTSIDRTDELAQKDGTVLPGVYHFNNYGLGSPFPEDAMLCAALSSFWPAAAPDVTRTFAPGNYATATPLTDDVLGQTGEEPWDGIPGPRIPDPKVNEVEYRAIEFGDYVQAALNNKFNIEKIAQTSAAEYAARTLVMARVYAALGAVTREEKRKWAVFSFTQAVPTDADRLYAEEKSKSKLSPASAYRFKIFEHKPVDPKRTPKDHRNKLVPFDKMLTLFADPQTVLMQDDEGQWTAKRY